MTTPTLIIVRKALHADMGIPQPAKLPIGAAVALQSTAQHQENTQLKVSIGVWESSPGKFRRHLPNGEFCHILTGRCSFIPDVGDPVTLEAGDAVLFPENCEGTWEVYETLRKTYVLL